MSVGVAAHEQRASKRDDSHSRECLRVDTESRKYTGKDADCSDEEQDYLVGLVDGTAREIR